jgi:inner membrane transporter RhtA
VSVIDGKTHGDLADLTARIPAPVYFFGSALFHSLGPSLAVLLFPTVGVLGVAWLRIAGAALVLSPFARPWSLFHVLSPHERGLLVCLGACLALMNCCFYLALARLPISLVVAIEFVGSMALALYGLRTGRNLIAMALVAIGATLLIRPQWASDLIGLGWAALNCLCFVVYISLGHRIAGSGARSGIKRLSLAMGAAFVFVFPFGIASAARAFSHPLLVLAGLGVGVSSSVIPYVCDQLVMARLPRATFALMLALLPVCATILGAIVLKQIPSARNLIGIALVVSGVAIHQPPRGT